MTFFRTAAVLSILLSSLAFGASPAFAANPASFKAPKSVHHYEVLEGFTESPAPQGGDLWVSFQAFGRRFDLILEKNPLFSGTAEDVWVNRHGNAAEHKRFKPQATLYKGKVHDEPESWVRVSVRDGILHGVIHATGELYFIEPAARFFRDPTESAMVVYRLSDTESELGPGSCGLENPETASALTVSDARDGTGSTSILSEFQALAATALKQIDLALVADYEYYTEHGSAAAADMQAVINQVDGILQAELGLTIRISQTVVHTSAADPFSDTTNGETLLNEFTTYKASSSSPIYGADLAQLFTNRDIDGTLIGIAWVGALCSGGWGSSLVQDFTSTAKSMTILSAHEIGHNLAAHHDAQLGSLCELIPFGFIMYPSISLDLNLQFSSCSKNSIAAHVATASCLATVGETPPSCSFTISPSSTSLGASGGSGSVSVNSTSGCSWTASSSASWLTISSGSSGSGAGTVVYAAGANPGPSSRSATLTVAGKTFTVSQSAPAAATLRVTAPNGGESWPAGASRTITWTSSGVSGYVKIELSRDGGTTWTVITSSTYNDGSQSWTVTSPATTRARFRVSSVTTPAVTDASDADVSITGAGITVSAPNGGEAWPIGVSRTINWTSSGVSGYVKIELSRDGGTTWTVLTSSTYNDGSHPWTVSAPATTRARFRVTSVSNTTIRDSSNGDFRIGGGTLTVTAPNGGESWTVGTAQRIRWSSTNLGGNVRIEISRDGVYWTAITSSTANDGDYSWVVTSPRSSNARVRIRSVNETAVSDTSNAAFAIR